MLEAIVAAAAAAAREIGLRGTRLKGMKRTAHHEPEHPSPQSRARPRQADGVDTHHPRGRTAAAIAIAAMLAGCGGGGGDHAAIVHATVAKGAVIDGSLCAHRIDAAGVADDRPLACGALDGAGRIALSLPAEAPYLLVASGLRHRDESAGGAVAAYDGTLQAVVDAGPERATVHAVVTPLTQIAVAALRARGTPLSVPAFEAMRDRVAASVALSGAQSRAAPVFDAAGQPVDAPAATLATFPDLGRDTATGAAAQVARFAEEFAKQAPDEPLAAFNRAFREALGARREADVRSLPTIYGWQGTAGPGATIDGERRCFVKARGIWVEGLTFQPAVADFGLCISQAPQGAACDAAFVRGLDFSGVDPNWGAANHSAAVMLRGALDAFTSSIDRYRLEFAARCEPFATLDTVLVNRTLYRPAFLAPMQ